MAALYYFLLGQAVIGKVLEYAEYLGMDLETERPALVCQTYADMTLAC